MLKMGRLCAREQAKACEKKEGRPRLVFLGCANGEEDVEWETYGDAGVAV